MTKYCVTAVRRGNSTDDRVSELRLWEYYFNEEKKKWLWKSLNAKKAEEVVVLLAKGHEVFSAVEKETSLSLGDKIEFILRIADNDKKFKITDMPTF